MTVHNLPYLEERYGEYCVREQHIRSETSLWLRNLIISLEEDDYKNKMKLKRKMYNEKQRTQNKEKKE